MSEQQEKAPVQLRASSELPGLPGTDERCVHVALEEIVAGLVQFYLRVAEARDDSLKSVQVCFDSIEVARKHLEARVSWIAESVSSRRS